MLSTATPECHMFCASWLVRQGKHPFFLGIFEHSAAKLKCSFILLLPVAAVGLSLLFLFLQYTRFCRRASWCSFSRILYTNIVNLQSGRTVH